MLTASVFQIGLVYERTVMSMMAEIPDKGLMANCSYCFKFEIFFFISLLKSACA